MNQIKTRLRKVEENKKKKKNPEQDKMHLDSRKMFNSMSEALSCGLKIAFERYSGKKKMIEKKKRFASENIFILTSKIVWKKIKSS